MQFEFTQAQGLDYWDMLYSIWQEYDMEDGSWGPVNTGIGGGLGNYITTAEDHFAGSSYPSAFSGAASPTFTRNAAFTVRLYPMRSKMLDRLSKTNFTLEAARANFNFGSLPEVVEISFAGSFSGSEGETSGSVVTVGNVTTSTFRSSAQVSADPERWYNTENIKVVTIGGAIQMNMVGIVFEAGDVPSLRSAGTSVAFIPVVGPRVTTITALAEQYLAKAMNYSAVGFYVTPAGHSIPVASDSFESFLTGLMGQTSSDGVSVDEETGFFSGSYQFSWVGWNSVTPSLCDATFEGITLDDEGIQYEEVPTDIGR